MATVVTDTSNVGFSLQQQDQSRLFMRPDEHNPNDNIPLSAAAKAYNSKDRQGNNNQRELEMIRVNSFDANCFEAQNKLQALEK